MVLLWQWNTSHRNKRSRKFHRLFKISSQLSESVASLPPA